jgi:hypothetical protein
MGKNGFATILVLTFFVISYSMVPIELSSAPILPHTLPSSRQIKVPLQLVPLLGLPDPMWDYTFGRDDGWADAWDIIQLRQSGSLFFGAGFLYIAGTFSYDPSSVGYLPYFATFSMPPDDTYCSFSHGSSYGNSTLSEAHSIVQTNEGIVAIAGAVDWLDDKSRAYLQVYYNGSMTPDSFYNGSVSDAAWSIIEHYPRAFVLAGVT